MDTARFAWLGSLDRMSGFGRVGRRLLWSLVNLGADVSVDARLAWAASPSVRMGDWSLDARIDRALRARTGDATGRTAVIHCPPSGALELMPPERRHILYTAFELDGVPPGSLSLVASFGRVWVPSTFCARALVDSGLAADRVDVVPHGLDATWTEVAMAREARSPTPDAPFVFLSVFRWEHRKGPDVLVRAFLRAFDRSERVRLRIVTGPRPGDPLTGTPAGFARATATVLGDRADGRIELIDGSLDEVALRGEFEKADAFVLPTRGEGFGLPILEALGAGVPTVATGWGGPLDFLHGPGAWPIPVARWASPPDGVVAPYGESARGLRLAEPDEDALVEILRTLYHDREAARAQALAGAEAVRSRWTWDTAAQQALASLRAAVAQGPATRSGCVSSGSAKGISDRPRLRLEGDFFAPHSLARVNRELVRALARIGDVEIEAAPTGADECSVGDPDLDGLSRAPGRQWADLCVRHRFPPMLGPAPLARRVAMVMPWEYGHFPRAWVDALACHGRELWVPSVAVQRMALRSGVSEGRVFVVPNGIDPARYSPDGPLAARLPTSRRCRFLFVGNGDLRKGLDVLLKAYSTAFDRSDDVSLLVKLSGAGGRYDLRSAKGAVESARARHNAPEIRMTDAELAEDELAALYRSVSCLVHPYRGEGFALPVLEAQACGTAVIVTAGGSTDDFVTDQTAIRLPAREVPLPASVSLELPLAGPGYWLEPDVDALVVALQSVAEQPEANRSRGVLAARHAQKHSWDVPARIILARMEAGR